MNLSKKMEEELNKQINAEWYSAYLYQSMSAFFESKNLKGFAHWMNMQALEELTHGQKIYNYIIERGGTVQLSEIKGPKTDWDSPLDVFEDALDHEQKVTSLINALVDLSTDEKDYPTTNMLQWFIDEQVEEESTADEIVQKLKLMKDAPGALYMLDKELSQRSFAPPKEEK